jgi:hypothetical protein
MSQCHHCGKELGEHPLDVGFSLPDVVWALDKDERDRRAKFDTDLCVLDVSRFFIRGIAFVPVVATDRRFCWGFWAEVTRDVFGRYLELYNVDAVNEPIAAGCLANTPVGYPPLQGHPVDIAFATARERPRFTLHASAHPLFLEQQNGIPITRVHEINALVDEGGRDRLARLSRSRDVRNRLA